MLVLLHLLLGMLQHIGDVSVSAVAAKVALLLLVVRGR